MEKLSAPETVAVPGGSVTATHRQVATVHKVGDGVFVTEEYFIEPGPGEALVKVAEVRTPIEGADYATLRGKGSAPGRFWPEDVMVMVGTIRAR